MALVISAILPPRSACGANELRTSQRAMLPFHERDPPENDSNSLFTLALHAPMAAVLCYYDTNDPLNGLSPKPKRSSKNGCLRNPSSSRHPKWCELTVWFLITNMSSDKDKKKCIYPSIHAFMSVVFSAAIPQQLCNTDTAGMFQWLS